MSGARVSLPNLSISTWCLPGALLEEADEMLGILKAEVLADLRDRESLIVQLFLGGSQQAIVDVFLGSQFGLALDDLSEVSGREVATIGEVGHGGQPLLSGLCTDIVSEQAIELLHHGVVDLLTGDKLAVVEPQAVVEQQLDVRDDQFPRVVVDGTLQLCFNQV